MIKVTRMRIPKTLNKVLIIKFHSFLKKLFNTYK